LLFPFTFLKINKVELHSGKKDDKHLIYLTIINKGKLFEKGLKKRFAFKLVENGSKIIIDKENNSKCIDNEKYYKMNFNYIDLEYLQSINNNKNDHPDTSNNNPDSTKNINNPVNNPINDPMNNPINNPMNNPGNNPMNIPANNPMFNPMNYPFYNPLCNPFYNQLNNPFYNPMNDPMNNPMNNPFFYFYNMLQANQLQNMMLNNENKNTSQKEQQENNNNLNLNTEPLRKITICNAKGGLKDEIIKIPINKTLKDLFIIYSGNVGIGVDNFIFLINAAKVNNNDQRLISEIFPYDGKVIAFQNDNI